jgi:hypothetical protein
VGGGNQGQDFVIGVPSRKSENSKIRSQVAKQKMSRRNSLARSGRSVDFR